MFLLECEEDNSLIIKRNDSVICDHKTVAPGNVVAFFHKKKKYYGKVKMIADDGSALKKEIEKMRLVDKKNLRKIPKTNSESSSGKRLSKRKLSYSPEIPPTKISRQKKQQIIENPQTNSFQADDENDTDALSDDDNGIVDNDFSDGLDDMNTLNSAIDKPIERSPLAHLSTSPLSSRTVSNSRNIVHNEKSILNQNKMMLTEISDNKKDANVEIFDDDDDDEDEKEQLNSCFGTENMKHIGNNIYCKTMDYKNAVKGTPSATAIARNLLVGVFKKEILVQGSVAGRSPRAQGPERMKKGNIRLNTKATQAIIKFAKDYAKKKNWTSETSDSKIKNAMAQKIVEMKGEDAKNSTLP